MTISIHCVPPDLTADVARATSALIVRGLDVAPEVDRPDLFIRLSDGRAQMWLILDGMTALGVVFTEIHTDDDAVHVFALCGSHPARWVSDFEARMRTFAKEEGCTRVLWAGKPAWRRYVPDAHIIGTKDGHAIFERAAQ